MRRASFVGVFLVALALTGCLRTRVDLCAQVPPHPECAILDAGRDAPVTDAPADGPVADDAPADAGVDGAVDAGPADAPAE